LIVSDIEDWVNNRTDMGSIEFRQAAHIILYAVSNSAVITKDYDFVFKGGAFLSIAMSHDRATTDIDFSTPQSHSENTEKGLVDELTLQLEDAELDMDYPTSTRVQSVKVKPPIRSHRTVRTYPTLHVTIGYANKNNPKALVRLNRYNATHTITVDFSFNEPYYDGMNLTLEDDVAGPVVLKCYSFEEVTAEKLRAILQQPVRNRIRQQDLYDVCRIIEQHNPNAAKTHDMLVKKATGRGIEKYLCQGGLSNTDVKDILKASYPGLKVQVASLPPFDYSFLIVDRFFDSMPW